MQDMAAGQEPDYGSSASVAAGEVELVAELRREVLSMDAVGCFNAPTAEVGSRHAEQRNYLIRRHRQCFRHKLCDDIFAKSLLVALAKCTVLWVHGKCGSGKSTKVPCSLEKVSTRGLVHVLSKKSATVTIHKWYKDKCEVSARMASIWTGDIHTPPKQSNFVLLTTEMSLVHLFLKAQRWNDVDYVLIDEVHALSPLTMFLLWYVLVHLKETVGTDHHIKLLLVTATPEGAGVRAVRDQVQSMS